MNGTLSGFQDAFAAALLGAPADLPQALRAQPGFAVYRNTVLKGCVDALEANFPSVARLVGRDWFRATAAEHARRSPPTRRELLFYGEDFPAFLADFAAVAELPYLSAVARLDRLWLEAHVAAEAPPLTLSALAGLPVERLTALPLRPRPTTRWGWFEGQPIYSLWHCNRLERPLPEPLPWQGEGALLVRRGGATEWQPLDHAGCAFLDACAQGRPLGQAAEAAADVSPEVDFVALLGRLVTAGAFQAIDREDSHHERHVR